jgi:hypothetical protein
MATLRKPSCSPILNVMLGRDPSIRRRTMSAVIERANRVRDASDDGVACRQKAEPLTSEPSVRSIDRDPVALAPVSIGVAVPSRLFHRAPVADIP